MAMSKEQALEKFSQWYEECVESGLEPEEIVARMGGMALVTDEDLVDRLREEGEIPSY